MRNAALMMIAAAALVTAAPQFASAVPAANIAGNTVTEPSSAIEKVWYRDYGYHRGYRGYGYRGYGYRGYGYRGYGYRGYGYPDYGYGGYGGYGY